MADPKLVTPDLTELERLKAAASEVCSHDPRYDGCPKCVAFEAYDEALHAAAGSLIQAARRLGEVEAAMRELAESGRRAEDDRCAQLTTANARVEALGAALLALYEVVDDNRNHIDDRSTRRDVDDALKAAESALAAAKVSR